MAYRPENLHYDDTHRIKEYIKAQVEAQERFRNKRIVSPISKPVKEVPQTHILTVDRCGGCYAEVSGHKCNYCGTVYRETKFTEDEKQEWFEIRQHFNPKGSTINERREQLGLPAITEDAELLDMFPTKLYPSDGPIKVYHGECLSCSKQYDYGLEYCYSCQYQNANWKLPDKSNNKLREE